MKRRDFLKTGLTVGIAANALPVMLGGMPIRALGRSRLRSALETQSANNNRVLVVIQLQGGNDGLNCVVPSANSPQRGTYDTLRPTLGIDKASVLPLSDHASLGFHPSMTGISTLYGEGKVALLQNVGYPSSSLSHFRGTDIWNTATDSNLYASTGWVGRLLLDLNPGYPPATIPKDAAPLALQFGNSLSNLFLSQAGGVGVAINRVPKDVKSGTHNYDDISQNTTTPYLELGYVRTIQNESEVYTQSIVDINKTAPANKVTYPTGNTLASQLASVARFIAGGFTTKIYLVTQGSYDTHSNQLTTQAKLLGDLSAAVLAFQQDLEALNVADQVAMMTYSEFGRRPQENGSGTDHGVAAPLFIMGTKVKGMVYGNDPKLDAQDLSAGNLVYDANHDFRNVYATVMNEWLLDNTSTNTANNTALIDSVLTTDAHGTYSATTQWNSLGIFTHPTDSVSANPSAPGLMLMDNYPNPAQGMTNIAYVLPAAGPVQLSVYNSAGEEVERPVEGWQEQGNHELRFDASKLRSGAYIYRLTTGAGEVTRRMVVEH